MMSRALDNKILFVFLCLAAYGLSYVPFVHVPFKWLEVYFHEISHGLMALLTGGKIISIQLHKDGSGLCYYQGGWSALISFSGYAGAVGWGLLVYLSARSLGKYSHYIAWVLLAMLSVSTVLWARDWMSILILLCMASLLFVLAWFSLGKTATLFTQFIGIYVMQSALQSPWYLFDGQSVGDGAKLASKTLLPEIVWIVIWIALALLGFWYAWKHQSRG